MHYDHIIHNTSGKRLHNKIFGTVYFGTQLSLFRTFEHFTLCHASTDPFRLPLFITVKYSTSYLYFRTQYAHKPLGEYEY